ncbi:MAG: lysophospholipid acyltransferase family protein [Alphaproteobacteria bacterium]|nr:lysophospholipid acyltransferase family protein [Alphaproteobacteria bacterium]
MKKLIKRLLRSPVTQSALALLVAGYIRLVHATTRWERIGYGHIEPFFKEKKPFIVAFWHGRLLLMPMFPFYNTRAHVLISHHRDGALIAGVMRYFGLDTVRGSSSKGARGAMRAMLELLEHGESIAITPDGPRGPRMHAQAGAVMVAKKSGVPIIPIAVANSRRKLLGSWDRFILALPFGRGVFAAGVPIAVPGDADKSDMERIRVALEDALNALTREADERVGVEPVTPASIAA